MSNAWPQGFYLCGSTSLIAQKKEHQWNIDISMMLVAGTWQFQALAQVHALARATLTGLVSYPVTVERENGGD